MEAESHASLSAQPPRGHRPCTPLVLREHRLDEPLLVDYRVPRHPVHPACHGGSTGATGTTYGGAQHAVRAHVASSTRSCLSTSYRQRSEATTTTSARSSQGQGPTAAQCCCLVLLSCADRRTATSATATATAARASSQDTRLGRREERQGAQRTTRCCCKYSATKQDLCLRRAPVLTLSIAFSIVATDESRSFPAFTLPTFPALVSRADVLCPLPVCTRTFSNPRFTAPATTHLR